MMRGLSWRHFDFWLLGAVVLATAFGVAMIRSAIAGNEELLLTVTRQTQFALIGLGVIFLVAAIDYNYWLALYRPMYVVMMILLIMIYISAQPQFGAARWFQIAGLFIQPTELAKIVIILILARYFEKTQNEVKDLRWLISSIVWVAGLTMWILLQPNLSNVIVIGIIWALMVWQNGVPVRTILILVFIVALIGLVAILIPEPYSPLQEYQRARVFTFLFPDPNASYGATYNVLQALVAIGSGGLWGRGYGHGTQTQLRFLKVRHTDFIFSAVSEEFGMIGGILVIVVLLFIIFRCLRAARLARDVSGSMIAYGVAVLIFFQGAVNIGVNVNLIPVSGLPLPFISYGGSGLLSLMLGIGLVESVVVRHRQLEF